MMDTSTSGSSNAAASGNATGSRWMNRVTPSRRARRWVRRSPHGHRRSGNRQGRNRSGTLRHLESGCVFPGQRGLHRGSPGTEHRRGHGHPQPVHRVHLRPGRGRRIHPGRHRPDHPGHRTGNPVDGPGHHEPGAETWPCCSATAPERSSSRPPIRTGAFGRSVLHSQGRFARELFCEAPVSTHRGRINQEMIDQGKHFPLHERQDGLQARHPAFL